MIIAVTTRHSSLGSFFVPASLAIINIRSTLIADVQCSLTKQSFASQRTRTNGLDLPAIANALKEQNPDLPDALENLASRLFVEQKGDTIFCPKKTASIMTEKVEISNFDQKWQVLNGL